VRLPREPAFPQHPDVAVAGLRDEVDPDDRLVRHGAVRQSEGPLPECFVRAVEADRRDHEATFDLVAHGACVLRDVRAEHGETTFVAELAVSIDGCLRGAPRQPSTSRYTSSTGRSSTPWWNASSKISAKVFLITTRASGSMSSDTSVSIRIPSLMG
jgi:hypothetical protein